MMYTMQCNYHYITFSGNKTNLFFSDKFFINIVLLYYSTVVTGMQPTFHEFVWMRNLIDFVVY